MEEGRQNFFILTLLIVFYVCNKKLFALKSRDLLRGCEDTCFFGIWNKKKKDDEV